MMNFSILIHSTIVYLIFGFVCGQFAEVNRQFEDAQYDQVDDDQFDQIEDQFDERIKLFESFIKKFGKNYSDYREYEFRFQTFKNTLDRINKLNDQRRTNMDALYGITIYSDLTPEEFKIKVINGQFKTKNSINSTQNQWSPTVDIDLLDKIKSGALSSRTLFSNIDRPHSLTKLDKLIGNYLSLSDQLTVNSSSIDFDQLIKSIVGDKNLSANLNSSTLYDTQSKISNETNIRPKRSTSIDLYWNEYDEMLPVSYPRMKDWRENRVISEVDNQNSCGACWAHSTIETIESMAAIKYGWSVDKRLSVQQLIDCSTNNYGCLGGDTCAVLSWIAVNKIKLLSAKAYPQRQSAGECRIKNDQIASGFTVLRNFTCTDFTNNEIELIKILANHGPVATTADASLWQDYLGGIIQFNCGREANHAVQIVGYNLKSDTPYYIVRNTWGSNFGINGYLHVAIGGNLCALEERVSALDVEMI